MKRSSYAWGGLVVMALFSGVVGCVPPPAPPVRAAEAPAAAAPDRTGLRFLVSDSPGSGDTELIVRQAFVDLMTKAGYQIVSDPSERFDAELKTRTSVTHRELVVPFPAKTGGRAYETTEHVELSVAVVVENHIIERVRGNLVVDNGKVVVADVVPTVDALGRSTKLSAFAIKVQGDREARARASAQTALR